MRVTDTVRETWCVELPVALRGGENDALNDRMTVMLAEIVMLLACEALPVIVFVGASAVSD